MNVIVIAHYQSDGSPCAIFIHEQNKELVKLGIRVKVISPIALGKRNNYGKRRVITEKSIVDCIEYTYLRYLSVSKYGKYNINRWSAIWSLKKIVKRIIKDFRPDIVCAHTLGIDSVIGLYLKRKLTIPLVIATHGSDLEIPLIEKKEDKIKALIFGANLIVTISKKLEKKVNELCPIARVKTIINGCNTEKCQFSKKRSMSLLFVGNLIPQKNADIVINVFARLKQRYPWATLVIVGEGSEKDFLLDLCEELGVRENVLFTGKINNDEVIKFMSYSEYFIMPSVKEGFGIVYIEAMACGCITIGTKGEGIDGFIIDRVNGFLAEPNVEEIYNIINGIDADNNFKETIRQKAYFDAHFMSWERNVLEYIKTFEDVIENDCNKTT